MRHRDRNAPGDWILITLPNAQYDLVGSIVIFENALEEVNHAIRQFFAMTLKNKLRAHLCIIDNSRRPLDLSQHTDPRISYHFANRNLGYGRGHNIALRASRGLAKYNLVMNTDITYAPKVVSRLKTVLDSNPKAGLAAPKILFPDGRLQHVCRLLPTPVNVFLRRFLPGSRWTEQADMDYELRWWDHDSIADIPFFQGSFLMLRTELCNELGGFDERYFLYAEDIDLCRRIHKVASTLYVPDVSITHEFRRYSRNSLLGTWYAIQSHWRYFNKWGWLFDSDRAVINARTMARLGNAAAQETYQEGPPLAEPAHSSRGAGQA
jgi:GT2 family glycosyltransferase